MSKETDSYKKYNNNKQNIVVALAADYGNLGDVAITYAQSKFLQDLFPEANIIDFQISKTFSEIKSLKSVIKPNDIITLVGGGNTGDRYDDIEYCRQFIIKQFPRNKIISFPQTVDFSDTKYGVKALNKAVKVYSQHEGLILSAREKKSYDKYKKNFEKNEIIFAPDIVLYLDKTRSQYNREGVMLVLRDDKEKSINSDEGEKLFNKLNKDFNVKINDTHIKKNDLSVEDRKKELDNMWKNFKKSGLVITDRLHGMLFSVITKTPCIAIDNTNKKVSGVYNAWLKDCEYIKLIKDFDQKNIFDCSKDILNKNIAYKKSSFEDEYEDLILSIKANY